MRLKAVLFKEEMIDGIYRAHFTVYRQGMEVTRFALEFTEKPSTEILSEKVGSMLEEIANSLKGTIQPETIIFEKEVS